MRTLFATLFIIHLVFSLQGQAPAIEWQKNFGGNNEDKGRVIMQTPDGGYIMAGDVASNSHDVSGNHGIYDFWVVRLDAAGAIQWKKSFGGSDYDIPYSMALTSDGGALVAGMTDSFDGDVTGNHGGRDVWIVKVSDSGNMQWQKCYGGSANESANTIIKTTDGGFVFAGFSSSMDGDANVQHDNGDFWIVKLNEAGVIQWQKSYGGSKFDNAYAIIQTTDNGFLVTGETQSSDYDVSGHHSKRDAWVVKLNENGEMEWQKCLGGSEEDITFSVLQNADGSYMAAGYSLSSDGDVSSNEGKADYWVVKLSSAGDILWEKSYGGSEHDFGYTILLSPLGGYVLGGYSASDNAVVTGNHGGYDFWMVRADEDGNILWQNCYGGNNAEFFHSFASTSDDGFILIGYSKSLNGDLSNNYGYFDFWVVKLKPENLVNSGKQIFDGSFPLSISPNPAADFITIDAKGLLPGKIRFQIFNTTGKILKEAEDEVLSTTEVFKIDVSALPAGLYFLGLATNKGKMTCGKFVRLN